MVRTQMSRRMPVTGILVALSIGIAACGGSSDQGTAATTPNSIDEPAVTTPPADTEATPETPAPTAPTAPTTTPPTTAPPAPPTEQRLVVTGPEEMVFDWTTDRCDDLAIPDIATRVVRDNNGQISLYIGNETTYRMTGTDFDSLVLDCTAPVMTSDNDADPAQFNDAEWIASTFTEDGETVYAIIHNEYLGFRHQDVLPGQCPSQDTFNCIDVSLTLGVSTDGGATFQDAAPAPDHLIATMPYTFNDEGLATGLWQTSNLVDKGDGYRYMLVNISTYADVETDNAADGDIGLGWICALRTDDVSDPTSWRYWDGEEFDGVFVDPYAAINADVDPEGVCAPVDFPALSAEMSESIIWVESIEKFVIAGGTHEPGDQSMWGTYYSTSDDLLDWSPRRLLVEAPIPATQPDGADMTFLAYPTLIDPDSTSLNFDTSDGSMYLYNTRFNFGGNSLDRDLVRVPVAFEEYAFEPVAWEFDTDGDAEGWRPEVDLTDFAAVGGSLTMTSTGDDPYMVSIGHRIASEFPTVSITMAADAGGQTWAEFFFLTGDEGRWGEDKLQTFEVIGDGEMHTYELDMSTIPGWTGVITALRVDPVGTANTAITIDRISIGN